MDIQEILCSREIIHSDPEIMSGMPVFVGSRVPLQTFFDYLEGEEGLAEFINDFPYLQTQAIKVLETIAKVMLHQQRGSRVHTPYQTRPSDAAHGAGEFSGSIFINRNLNSNQ